MRRGDWHRQTPDWVVKALGRPERSVPDAQPMGRVLVTGASGSLGGTLVGLLAPLSWEVERGSPRLASSVCPTDVTASSHVGHLDVLDEPLLMAQFAMFRPDVVFHLAGAKHAPQGETDPWGVCRVNVQGTANVLAAAGTVGARVVVASTCKACDPETAYGASKLIAERLALNAKAVVVRFHNVVNSAGNVFEKWGASKNGDSIQVAPCTRFFISAKEAVRLTAWAAGQPSGRYVLHPGNPRRMEDVARALYPDRGTVSIQPRRGDRLVEPFMAANERVDASGVEFIARVASPHDPREEL